MNPFGKSSPAKGGPFSQLNREDQQKAIQDMLVMECSLFRLTRKCVKICRDKEAEQLFKEENFENRADVDQRFKTCLDRCTREYVTFRRIVKVKLMDEIDKVQVENQKIFDEFGT